MSIRFSPVMLLALMFLSAELTAQKSLEPVADEICACMEERNSRGSDSESVFEECIGVAMMTNLSQLEKRYGDDFLEDDQVLETFA